MKFHPFSLVMCILSSLKHFIIFNKLIQYWGIEAEWSSDFFLGGFGLVPVLYSFIITQWATLRLLPI